MASLRTCGPLFRITYPHFSGFRVWVGGFGFGALYQDYQAWPLPALLGEIRHLLKDRNNKKKHGTSR